MLRGPWGTEIAYVQNQSCVVLVVLIGIGFAAVPSQNRVTTGDVEVRVSGSERRQRMAARH